MQKVNLKYMEFYVSPKLNLFGEAEVKVTPGHYSQCFFAKEIDPASPEFWGMALRVGFVHYQFHQGLQLAPHTYTVWAPRRAPRSNRQDRNLNFEAKEA